MPSTPQTPARARPRAAILVGLAVVAILGMAAGARPHLPTAEAIARIPPVIAVHLAAALAALALGAALMLIRKGRTFHRIAGWAWAGLVALVAGSSLFITSITPGRYSVLHLLTGWTLIVLPLAVFWARRHDVVRHRRTMMGLFYGGFAFNLFIAFMPGRTLWMLVFG
ncbi:hypothetical protein LJR225_003561 [Phenylobacterium sp. LjRoot225]|uniref:DUF2306 domain-containing protein n=1 Tax=Phenylobacterium sp. LjRoot225 TaxID=3342285 RepID=UPI003ECCDEF2